MFLKKQRQNRAVLALHGGVGGVLKEGLRRDAPHHKGLGLYIPNQSTASIGGVVSQAPVKADPVDLQKPALPFPTTRNTPAPPAPPCYSNRPLKHAPSDS